MSPIPVDPTIVNTGIIDENSATSSFNVGDNEENTIENLIFQQNTIADKGNHFTLVVATTLSQTVQDREQSRSVGLEELRGAYIAQRLYNEQNSSNKLRLVIANLGEKYAANETVPRVIKQIAHFANHAAKSDHFAGVIGFPFSDTAKQAMPYIHQYKLPVVSSTASSDELSNELPEFHRISYTNKAQTPYLLQFMENTLRPNNVFVLIDNRDSSTKSLGQNIVKGLSTSTISETEQTFGGVDGFDSILDQIKQKNYDLIFFAGFPNELNVLKEKMKERGMQISIMGGQSLYEVGGYTDDTYSHLFFSATAFPDAPENGPQNFQANYGNILDPNKQCRAIYGCGRSSSQATSSYDAVQAYINALTHLSGDINPDNMKIALAQVSFEGATGYIEFSGQNSNSGNKPVYMLCVDKDRRTHEVLKYNPNGTIDTFEPITVC